MADLLQPVAELKILVEKRKRETTVSAQRTCERCAHLWQIEEVLEGLEGGKGPEPATLSALLDALMLAASQLALGPFLRRSLSHSVVMACTHDASRFAGTCDRLQQLVKSGSAEARATALACLTAVAEHRGAKMGGSLNALLPLVQRAVRASEWPVRVEALRCLSVLCDGCGLEPGDVLQASKAVRGVLGPKQPAYVRAEAVHCYAAILAADASKIDEKALVQLRPYVLDAVRAVRGAGARAVARVLRASGWPLERCLRAVSDMCVEAQAADFADALVLFVRDLPLPQLMDSFAAVVAAAVSLPGPAAFRALFDAFHGDLLDEEATLRLAVAVLAAVEAERRMTARAVLLREAAALVRFLAEAALPLADDIERLLPPLLTAPAEPERAAALDLLQAHAEALPLRLSDLLPSFLALAQAARGGGDAALEHYSTALAALLPPVRSSDVGVPEDLLSAVRQFASALLSDPPARPSGWLLVAALPLAAAPPSPDPWPFDAGLTDPATSAAAALALRLSRSPRAPERLRAAVESAMRAPSETQAEILALLRRLPSSSWMPACGSSALKLATAVTGPVDISAILDKEDALLSLEDPPHESPSSAGGAVFEPSGAPPALWAWVPAARRCGPGGAARAAVHAAVDLLCALYFVLPQDSLRQQVLEALSSRKRDRSVAFALLSLAREGDRRGKCVATRESLVPILLQMLLSLAASEDRDVRRAACEALGLTGKHGTDRLRDTIMKHLLTKLAATQVSSQRMGFAFAVACMFRHVGNMRLGAYTVVPTLLMAAQQCPVWGLHALQIVIEAQGLSFLGSANAALVLILGILNSDEQASSVVVVLAVGQVINALAGSLGWTLVELRNESAFLSLCTHAAREFRRPAYHAFVQLEAVRFLKRVILFAPQTLRVADAMPFLRRHFSSPHLGLRSEAFVVMRQLFAQASLQDLPMPDLLRIEESLLRMLDRESDKALRGDLHLLFAALVTKLLEHDTAACARRWMAMFHAVSSTRKHGSVSRASGLSAMENAAIDDDDDEVVVAIDPSADEDETFVPGWRSKAVLVQCLGDALERMVKSLKKASELGEWVGVAFSAACSDLGSLRPQGVRLLGLLIDGFGGLEDPDDVGSGMLSLYQAQLSGALAGVLRVDAALSPPPLMAEACALVPALLRCRLDFDAAGLRRLLSLLQFGAASAAALRTLWREPPFARFGRAPAAGLAFAALGALASSFVSRPTAFDDRSDLAPLWATSLVDVACWLLPDCPSPPPAHFSSIAADRPALAAALRRHWADIILAVALTVDPHPPLLLPVIIAGLVRATDSEAAALLRASTLISVDDPSLASELAQAVASHAKNPSDVLYAACAMVLRRSPSPLLLNVLCDAVASGSALSAATLLLADTPPEPVVPAIAEALIAAAETVSPAGLHASWSALFKAAEEAVAHAVLAQLLAVIENGHVAAAAAAAAAAYCELMSPEAACVLTAAAERAPADAAGAVAVAVAAGGRGNGRAELLGGALATVLSATIRALDAGTGWEHLAVPAQRALSDVPGDAARDVAFLIDARLLCVAPPGSAPHSAAFAALTKWGGDRPDAFKAALSHLPDSWRSKFEAALRLASTQSTSRVRTRAPPRLGLKRF